MNMMHKYEVKVHKKKYKDKIKEALKSIGLKIARESTSIVVAKDAPAVGSSFVNTEEHEKEGNVEEQTVKEKLEDYVEYIEELYFMSNSESNKSIKRYIVQDNTIVEK